MKTDIRLAELKDVYELAPRLRQQDRNEVWASHHLTGEQALFLSFEAAEICYTAEYDGKVIAMFGVSDSREHGGGIPWLLGSDEVERLPVTLFRQSRKYVNGMLEQYGYLVNYVDARNTLSIQWLMWLGFIFEQAAPYGEEGMPFHKFWKRKSRP